MKSRFFTEIKANKGFLVQSILFNQGRVINFCPSTYVYLPLTGEHTHTHTGHSLDPDISTIRFPNLGISVVCYSELLCSILCIYYQSMKGS